MMKHIVKVIELDTNGDPIVSVGTGSELCPDCGEEHFGVYVRIGKIEWIMPKESAKNLADYLLTYAAMINDGEYVH